MTIRRSAASPAALILHALLFWAAAALSPTACGAFSVSSLPRASSSSSSTTTSLALQHRDNECTTGRPELDGSRRSALTSLVRGAGAAILTPLALAPLSPQPANAAYGASANQELPNYIDFLLEKNRKITTDGIVYQGADTEAQLRRLLDASQRLAEIPDLAAAKKWSQVQGILLGPLGTLLQTMTAVAGGNEMAKKAAAKVKGDIFAINTAASKKNDTGCIDATVAASKDLEAFVKLVF